MGVKITIDEKAIRKGIMDAISREAVAMKCPYCHTDIKLTSGKHPCPRCRKMIDVKLNFK